jgi:hypothetical protein
MENTGLLLRICWSVIALTVITTVGVYTYNFNNHVISQESENWGHFGDYLGGTLNPIISLVNLVVLTYITISINRIEDRRNRWTLQELARPRGQIVCGDYENLIEVKLKNCGLGPLIIKNIIIRKTDGSTSNSLIHEMPKLLGGLRWTDFVLDAVDYAIPKDSEINLIKIQHDPNDYNFTIYKHQIRTVLKEIIIEVVYTDMYDRPMTNAVRNLSFFGRTLE